jgi:putative membrane protein
MKRMLTSALAGALVAGSLAAGGGAIAGAASSKATGQDQTYLQNAIEGDRFEIQGGRLAERQGSSAAVKALGRRLVTDHTKSLSDARKLAKALGVSVPSSPSPSETWELSVVRTFTGKNFDHWYSRLEVQDHKQDITEATDETKLGGDASVKADARKELPTLRTHLALAQAAMKAS